MKSLVFPLVLLFLFVVAVGCESESKVAPEPDPLTPLSVAAWKQLPVEEKYDPQTFERLKLKDPKLRPERAWHQFMKKVVVPERKRDIPEG